MRTWTLWSWTLAIFAAGAFASGRAEAERPDILLIAIDDLNDWVGPLGGHLQVKTPHMDALARRGTVFANAHCQSPLCNPSRTSFLTGLRPSTSGVYALDPWFRTAEPLKDRVTVLQHLRSAGYRVHSGGKIFHDAYPPPPARRDASEVDVWGYHGNAGPRPPAKFVESPAPHPLVDWGVFPDRDEDQEDSKIADWAIAQLESPPEGSFALAVGFRRPHVPCYASQPWFDLYPEADLILPRVKANDRDDVPPFAWHLHWSLPEPRLAWLEVTNQWRPLVRAYLASISYVDSQVGRVLEALEKSGRAGNTLVVLFSDHGWHLGEKGITGKNTLWERSTRVPMIVAGPGVAAGQVRRSPAELLDIYPTLIDVCGLPPREGLEGHSLGPLLRPGPDDRPFPAITTHGPNNHGVRSMRHRYIRYADGSEELYDLEADPHEWTNRAADPTLADVKAKLAGSLPGVNAAPVPGSKTRLVEIRDGVVWWEGKPIPPGAAVPDR